MNTINSLKDSENVFSGLFVRKRERTSAAAYFASFLTNRVIILRNTDFKMQTDAHYLRDSIVLLRMWMEIRKCVAVSCCGYCSVS